MIITDDLKVDEIQSAFNTKFINLKIEFYTLYHKQGEGSPEKTKIESHKTIGDIRTINNTKELSINGHQKVSTLENNFLINYGLNIQVFRKSGVLWLQTTSTDDWTLTAQNKRGEKSYNSTD